ncbi:MAG TPA: putative metal-binding motif-containing protein [Candidatus Polarisedimenticolia bacterium]|nr:putative metal-binding motif-containing protein [Candidatus Polarisedimenticolia bacterium]
MPLRTVIRSTFILLVGAILAAPLALQQGFTEGACAAGTYPVVNTGECAAGPYGHIVRNKVGKLMDISKCATYQERAHDEASYSATAPAASVEASAFTTTNDQDFGNIAWIQDTDGLCVFQDSLGTRIDIACAVRKFMITHQDVYDYVAVFPNFNHAEGSFHLHVKNDVRGIGVPIQDNSASYGTQNLKSVILFRNFGEWPAGNHDRIMIPAPNNDSPMSLISHEVGHRVAAWVRRDKDPSTRVRVANDLLGRNNAHWCFYLDGPGTGSRAGYSSMEGNLWRDNGDGTFTTSAQADGYSRLDQYLWGYRSGLDVGTFFRLDPGKGKVNPDCSHIPYIPGVDTPWTFSYPKINVTVDDIIAAEGARIPTAQNSQKNWRVAFVMLARQGVSPNPTEIAKLDAFRQAWSGPDTAPGTGYFLDESGGGRMFTLLGPVDMDGDGFNSTTDCDENDASINPGAAEACNFHDDDCDGIIDDGFDADGDLYTTCNGDCNDADILINPGAAEVANGIDDDCDEQVDNINVDNDGDGYAVNPLPGGNAEDCDDSDPDINPGEAELVNGIDDNCNGFVDCADPTVSKQSDTGPRGSDGFDNDCNGVIDG